MKTWVKRLIYFTTIRVLNLRKPDTQPADIVDDSANFRQFVERENAGLKTWLDVQRKFLHGYNNRRDAILI